MTGRKVAIFCVIALTVFVISRGGNARRANAEVNKPAAVQPAPQPAR